MVFENIFNMKDVFNKPVRFFGIVIIISFIGIITSYLLFPEYLGVMSVAFIALLLLPIMKDLFVCTMDDEPAKGKITLGCIIQRYVPLFKVFFILMLAVFVTFLFMGIIHSPEMSATLFKEQMRPIPDGIEATSLDFNSIAQNNLKVLYVTFGMSLLYGAGVIIMLSWNASVWGVIIGSTIRKGLSLTEQPILQYLLSNFVAIVPHLVLESFAYLGAAISGGLLVMCAMSKHSDIKRFLHILTVSLSVLAISVGLILLSALIEINI